MSEGLRLLASLVTHGSTTTLRHLGRDMFVGDDEQRVYDFVRTHYRTYSQLPELQTIARETQLRIPEAREPVDYYLGRLRNRSMFNAVTPIYNDLHQSLVDGDAEVSRRQIAEMNAACRTHDPEQDLLSASDVGEDVLRYYYQNRSIHGLSGIPTGWGTLDLETNGYQNGDLIVWAARPAVGKTHMLIHQCKTAWELGRSVLFVSMEMTLQQIGARFFAHMSGIDPNFIRRAKLSTYAERRMLGVQEVLRDSNRFHLYAGNMGKRTEDLNNVIQELGPDAVYLDGMYLLKPTEMRGRRIADRHQAIAYVLDDLKEMTIRRDRPIIATTQFNRAGASRPSLETLGYTDAIGTHASVVLGAYLDPNDRTRRPSLRLVDVLKGREGEASGFATNYTFAPMDFSEAEMPDRGDESEGDARDRVRNRRYEVAGGRDWMGEDED